MIVHRYIDGKKVESFKTSQIRNGTYSSDDFSDEELKFLDLIDGVRNSNGSKYGMCMESKMKIVPSKDDDSTLR